MAVNTRRMVGVVLTTGSGKTYTLDTYPGDYKITGLQEGGLETIRILDRGVFVERVYGDDQPCTLTIDVMHDGALTSAAATKLIDMLKKQSGSFVASDTTVDPGGQVWALKVVLTVTHPGGTTTTITCGNARPTGDYSSAKEGNTLSMSFECDRTASAEAVVFS